ncbi:MAG: hypothetical protein RL456_2404 [Pseudomonadota bacterium]|jgi:hypothetical protein
MLTAVPSPVGWIRVPMIDIIYADILLIISDYPIFNRFRDSYSPACPVAEA